MKNLYNEDYFERGIKAGVSCYENYRWIQEETIDMCKAVISFASIDTKDTILDFGCAKGFLVKAFLTLGYDCRGVDISDYAISECDPYVKDRVKILKNNEVIEDQFDVIISKDVLEHITYERIESLVKNFREKSKKLVVVVPLAENGKYVAPEYELDITHIIREDIVWWENLFKNSGFNVVSGSYKVKGIKDKWSQYERSNGFFVCT
jgi:SAM-dependent methyltransferase